jgi:hypothetical protein
VTQQNIVPFQPPVENYGSRSLTAADVRAQVNLMQDVMQEVMKKETHYGVIPGTKQPSLYKAGAEKIMSTFRLAADPQVESIGIDGEVAYRVKVNILSASGTFLGAGIGECSSSEDKYAWRAALCDEEFDLTPENRRRIKFSKYQGKVEKKKQVRTTPADVSNTVLKMAKKRGLIDGVLTVTAASDLFTQDIEDLPEEIVAEMMGAPRVSAAAVAAVAQTIPPDSPERNAAIKEAEEVAKKGVEAFREMWAGWPKEKRRLVGDKLAGFQMIAEKAGAADAEPAAEVPAGE